MASASVRLWVGTYPDPEHPGAEGVWSVDLDPRTGSLAAVLRARTPAPSFLAVTPDGRTVFAAGETSPGAVTRFAVTDDGALVERERVSSGGSSPCHLLLHPTGRALYAANYASGSVAVLPLRVGAAGETGLVGGVAQVFEHSGAGPDAGRQEGPHAHQAVLAPGADHLLALDLGTDELRRYRLRTDGLLDADGLAARLPAGTGPRHAVWGPGGHLYVVGELDARVHVLAWGADATAREVGAAPLAGAGGEAGLPAHVAVLGDRLLVSLRGPDAIAVLDIVDGGARLVRGPRIAAGAGWPRHFVVVAAAGCRWLVVAGQGSGRVVALPAPGGPVAADVAGGSVPVPAPACVVVGRVAPAEHG